jgi:hypothetical protein
MRALDSSAVIETAVPINSIMLPGLPLSPRERAGVRGKGALNPPTLRSKGEKEEFQSHSSVPEFLLDDYEH